jgi:hypothetical protein
MAYQDAKWQAALPQIVLPTSESVSKQKYFHTFGEVAGKVSLTIEFDSPEALAGWLDFMKSIGNLPPTATPYVRDSLDSGVKATNNLVLKNQGDRPEAFRLRVETLRIGGL